MSLKERLLWHGYLPENVPPAFYTADVADLLAEDTGGEWWSQTKSPVRPATFNASKRGITRRTFSFVHPATMHDGTKFVVTHWETIQGFFAQSNFSLSVPKVSEAADRAVEIATHSHLEASRIERLSQYRFVAKTDVSRFYHSIYTHSIPWAFHGKKEAKADRDNRSAAVFFNRADWLLRCGQDGQTVGIPVGPDTSRVFAEIIATAIDLEFIKRSHSDTIAVLRHVDDVWIGANSHADAEQALWRYREAMREFELDINESKTKIYSAEFRFTDQWPSDLSVALERALETSTKQKSERLRAALEQAFAMTVATGDDGILKYVIRYLDRHSDGWENWAIVEPFLKRCVVHFGHTVDYISRVLLWRHLAKGDLHTDVWGSILAEIIDRHGRIGNDSEVCWAAYACAVLGCKVSADSADHVVRNCGALSVVTILNCAAEGLTERSVFASVRERLRLESANGAFWPVILEWKSRRWRDHKHITVGNEIIDSLVSHEARLFDITRLPLVFKDIAKGNFDEVDNAIENRPTMYDDENSQEGPDEDDDDF
jgi:Reverse transcriptase (RNA-dependent DNA polymerase)